MTIAEPMLHFGQTAQEKKEVATELRKQTVACRLRHWRLGVRKALERDQLRKAAQTFDANEQTLSATKKLIDTKDPAWRAVVHVRQRATSYWRSMTVPYPEPGTRLIRRGQVDVFSRKMEEFADDLKSAAAKLQEKYEELRSRAAQQLGELFNPTDYPPSIGGEFGMEWDFPSVDPPEYLKQLNPELYERQCQLAQARIEQAVQLTEAAFTEQFAKLVSHLTDRLKGDLDGKPKVFRDSAVKNLQEFFEQFKSLDVGSSGKLQDLVSAAQQAVGGVTPDDLRGNQDVRATVADQLGQIQAAVDQLMIAKPKRAIHFEEDSDDNM